MNGETGGTGLTPPAARQPAETEHIRQLLSEVRDPEIPVLSIADLGVLRSVHREGKAIIVTITPTYSGCPAMKTMEDDILAALHRAGFADARVRIQLSPAWSSDWLGEDARRKLREYGIAPPSMTDRAGAVPLRFTVACPRCGAARTERISEFGSTACKALYRCLECLEPFDYFKRI